MKTVTLTSRPRRKDGIIAQEAAGTRVLLSLEAGQYFALDEVGIRIWDLCEGTRTVAEIATLLAGEFDSPLETIQRDLLELLTDLANEHLVEADL